jgi:glycogen debranching enzyme
MIGSDTNRNRISDNWQSVITKSDRFITKTAEHALEGINPGGYYQAIWCRDAAYILRDWFLSGNTTGALQQLYMMWSHQIEPGKERKLFYGRGSPEMKFQPEVADDDKQREFRGALPTTIYPIGFSEIYGQNPDIDSTASIISTTSWILHKMPTVATTIAAATNATASTRPAAELPHYLSAMLLKLGITDPQKLTEYVIPRMLKAVDYLASRDIDGDGLLEQSHNEDWMDTVLRAGKIVYSQACWILALNDLSTLLLSIGQDKEARRIKSLASRAINAVEQKLWSEQDGAYMDIQEDPCYFQKADQQKLLTQDVSLYLVAVTENTAHDWLGTYYPDHFKTDHDTATTAANDSGAINAIKQQKDKAAASSAIASGDGTNDSGNTGLLRENIYTRAHSTFDTIRSRLWKDEWPLVTETTLKTTGPWVLEPYEYHNHTFWPWTTAIEMLARSRFGRIEECDTLLSRLASDDHPHMHTFYEWVNPLTDEAKGAFPFRTGISAVRIALAEILGKVANPSPPSPLSS